MSQIQKVAVAGASGNLGPTILSGLIKAGFDVTVLTRSPEKKFSSEVQVVKVDFEDPESIKSALEGQDALISTLAGHEVPVQKALIDAAVAAGVSRFVPSEFGSDFTNAKLNALPMIYAPKAVTRDYLTGLAKEGKISYTIVVSGPFLDFCIMAGLFINMNEKSIELCDGGDRKFSTTTLKTVGDATAAALKLGDKTKNKVIKIHEVTTTQNELLSLAKEVAPGDWKVTHADTATLESDAREQLSQGKVSQMTAILILKRAIFGEGYGGEFTKDDNELIGVKPIGKEQVREVLAKYA